MSDQEIIVCNSVSAQMLSYQRPCFKRLPLIQQKTEAGIANIWCICFISPASSTLQGLTVDPWGGPHTNPYIHASWDIYTEVILLVVISVTSRKCAAYPTALRASPIKMKCLLHEVSQLYGFLSALQLLSHYAAPLVLSSHGNVSKQMLNLSCFAISFVALERPINTCYPHIDLMSAAMWQWCTNGLALVLFTKNIKKYW